MKGRKNPSLATRSKLQTGKNHPKWAGGLLDHICKKCGKIFKARKSEERNFCSHECYYKAGHSEATKLKISINNARISGENHFNWNGGKSFEPYPLGWTKTYKEQIRRRDSYKCQICGCPEAECSRKLCVHHIDYNKHNLLENNLISLCINCHIKTNYKRQEWIKYFNIKEDVLEAI